MSIKNHASCHQNVTLRKVILGLPTYIPSECKELPSHREREQKVQRMGVQRAVAWSVPFSVGDSTQRMGYFWNLD